MPKLIIDKICLHHQSKIIALNLEKVNNINQAMLCAKCLIEKQFTNQNKAIIINEIPQIMKEMRSKVCEQKSLDSRYQYFVHLSTLITHYKELIIEITNKMLYQISEKIEYLNQQVGEANEQNIDQISSEDLDDLCQYLDDPNKLWLIEQQKDQKLLQQLQGYVSLFQQSDLYNQLISQLDINILWAQQNNQIDIKKQSQSKCQLIQNSYEQTYFNGKIEWKFSQQLKHKSIKLSNCCKIAEQQEKNDSVILCDSPIPQNEPVFIELKILKLDFLFVGVCEKSSINRNFEILVYNKAQHNKNWCYFMSKTGNLYMHQQDPKQNNFKFNVNDIIRMETNDKEKKIVWVNKSQSYPQVVASVPFNKDLYFCFGLSGNTTIELL